MTTDHDAIHTELLRLLARRGELVEAREQTELAIARYRGMFDLARAVNAEPTPASDLVHRGPVPSTALGGESSAPSTGTRNAPDSRAGAPDANGLDIEGAQTAESAEKPATARPAA